MKKSAITGTGIRIAPAVDWAWVRRQVAERERISSGSGSGNARSKREIAAALDDCIKIAAHLVKPVIRFSGRGVIGSRERFTLKGPLPLGGGALLSYLGGSTRAYLFLATIGPDLEETATMLMEGGEELHGYLLDRIGSFAVESLAERFEKDLRAIYRERGMSVSMRFSPGYCDWPVEEQALLERALDFTKAGVRLTESCMMIPRKSVSGLVGVGPKGRFLRRRSQCVICDNKECGYRRN